MGYSYLVSLVGSRSSEADLVSTLLLSGKEENIEATIYKKQISQRGHDRHYFRGNKECILSTRETDNIQMSKTEYA